MKFKTLFLVIISILFHTIPIKVSHAQKSTIIESFDKGDFETCLKLCEKEIKAASQNLDAYLFTALIWSSRISSKNLKYKNATSEALKQLKTLRIKDKKALYIKEHQQKYDSVRMCLLKQADSVASVGKFNEALLLYKDIMYQLNDQSVQFYIGCSWIHFDAPYLGLQYLQKGLEAYSSIYKKTGKKPEFGFLEKLLPTIEILCEQKNYKETFDIFPIIDSFYLLEDSKIIDDCYFNSLKTALNSINSYNEQLNLVLQEHDKALRKYPNEESIQNLKNLFIKNETNFFATYYPPRKGLIERIEKSFRYILDSLSNKESSLFYINEALLASIYSLHQNSALSGEKEKSFILYDLFSSIHNDYNKKINAAQKCLDYGLEKEDLLMQATALLIYQSKEKERNLIAPKLKLVEKRGSKRIKKLGTSYKDFEEVIYWLNHFPTFDKYKKNARAYFYENSKILLDSNLFSKAGLFLFRAREFFPDDLEIKSLQRACLAKDYKLNYRGSAFGCQELNWTGNVEGCQPGSISHSAAKKIKQRYEFIRRYLNFPTGTELDTSDNKQYQAAALCMKAQGELSHNPSEDWKCYSEDAAKGALNSLGIHYGRCIASRAIPQMIEDSGDNNKATGHRGNLLIPRNKVLVYGATDNTVVIHTKPYKTYSDIVLTRFNTDFISWPPRGPAPSTLVFDRWSFKPYSGAFTFENATVSMTLDGNPLALEIEYNHLNKIGWVPKGIDKWTKKEQLIKVVVEADVKRLYKEVTKREKFEYEVLIIPAR